jgi:hypothetical protein
MARIFRPAGRFERFGRLRSRELLANCLICAVLNTGRPTPSLTFSSDPQGGDGILYDTEMQIAWPTEHVMVPKAPADETRDIATLILTAISNKQAKGGAAYGRREDPDRVPGSGLGRMVSQPIRQAAPESRRR